MAHITRFSLNNTIYVIANQITEDIQVYQGRELSEYSWTQIKEKITNGDYSDLRIGDYKTVTLTTGETIRAQIAGIDTYYGFGDSSFITDHHIDFISVDCLKDPIKWRNTADNNGTSTEKSPYMNSNIQTYLNNTILPKLPTDLKDIILNKRMLMETRYASSKLKDTNNWEWKNLGKLWIPIECEICGSPIFGTEGRSITGAMQYPLFANSTFHRVKKLGNNGSKRADWWLATVASNSTTGACYMNHMGYPSYHNVTDYSHGVPLCFRIGSYDLVYD